MITANLQKYRFYLILLTLTTGLNISPVAANDIVLNRSIGLGLATAIAAEAVRICRSQGYHVSVVIVDKNAILRVAMRDDLASRFTLQISEEKANLAVMAGTSTGTFRDNRGDIRPELNHVDGIIVMQGGIEIKAGGYRLGAIGVSGAPGGDKDAACAIQALEKYNERLEFAEIP